MQGAHTAGYTTSTVPSTERRVNVHLPSEMINKVVGYLSPEIWYNNCFDTAKKQLKTGLAASSLTCRYWALIIRRMLFRSLVLRNAEDLDQLFIFLYSSTPTREPLSSLVHDIGIELDGSPQRPWLHRLPKLSSISSLEARRSAHQRGSSEILYRIRVVGCAGPDPVEGAPQMIHALPSQNHPRSIPQKHPVAQSLWFEGLRLRNSDSLAQLIHSFSPAAWCSIHRVSFADSPHQDARLPIRRRTAGCQAVWVSQCGDGFGPTQFRIAAAVFHPAQRFEMDDEDWDFVREAISAYTPTGHDSVSIELDAESFEPNDTRESESLCSLNVILFTNLLHPKFNFLYGLQNKKPNTHLRPSS